MSMIGLNLRIQGWLRVSTSATLGSAAGLARYLSSWMLHGAPISSRICHFWVEEVEFHLSAERIGKHLARA